MPASRLSFLFAFALFSGVATAAEPPILIDARIPLADGVSDRMPECPWATELAAGIATHSKGAVATTTAPLAEAKGRTLHLRVTHLRVPGGGNFSGPKWIRLQGELKVDGQTVDTLDLQRTSASGFPRNACNTARMVSKVLAKDVALWAKAHAYTLPVAPSVPPPATEATPAAQPAMADAPAGLDSN